MGVRVRQKTKGKGNPWWVFVSHNGQRTSRKVGDKEAAEEVASAIRAKLKLGEFDFEKPKTVPTFGRYSKKWLYGYVKLNLRESTLDEYESILNNHVSPVFKALQLDFISRGAVRDFLLSKHNSGLSVKRVKIIKDVLSGLFNYALDEELIATNPTAGISKRLFPKTRGKKRTIGKDEVFTKEELDLFLGTCETHFAKYYPFFLMAARTGMRLGDLLALRWGDIDFNSSYIWIKRSYSRGRYTRPKNGKSRKTDISNQLAEVLQGLLTKPKRKALKTGSGEVPELEFNRLGASHGTKFHSEGLRAYSEKAKLRYIKFHGFRHTFCTHLLSEGVSPYYGQPTGRAQLYKHHLRHLRFMDQDRG